MTQSAREKQSGMRLGFRRARFNVPTHFHNPGENTSPCGSDRDSDLLTQYPEDVTCKQCRTYVDGKTKLWIK